MKPVVATIIYDRDSSERARILEGLREWRNLGLEVIASAGGASGQLRDEAAKLRVTLLDRNGRLYGHGMRQAIKYAGGVADTIIWTEGDKSRKFGFQNYAAGCLTFF